MEKEPVVHLNFFDLALLLVKWRKLFIVNFLIVVAVAVVMVLVLPVWYTSYSVILPPSGGSGGIPSFLPSNLKGVAADFGLDVPTDQIYQSILNSRSLKENIIERFDLRNVYEMSDKVYDELVIETFASHYEVETRKDEAIRITIEDQSPKRSAEMADACVEELDKLYRKITSETARNNRLFIGKRLGQATDSLSILQDSLMRFQESTNAVSLSDQMFATINAAADMKARQIAGEIQLDVLKSSYGSEHPKVSQLERTTFELGKRYEKILSGSEGDLFLGLQDMPQISRKYAEFVRRVRVKQTLLEFIYPQYESSLIQEQRETANVQILDRARVPERKTRPPRRIIVMIAGAASILFTLVLVLVIEYIQTLPQKNNEDWQKVQKIRKNLWRRKSD